MSKVITLGGNFPPDNSGTWYDDGWGGWTQDANLFNLIQLEPPKGYYIDDGWGGKGLLIPFETSPSLDTDTTENVTNSIKQAKAFEDTKVGRILSTVLEQGQSFLGLLKGFGIIKNVAEPISYANIDKEKARQMYDSGQLRQQSTYQIEPPKTGGNSTYFGIDFSKPVTWIVVFVICLLLYKVFNATPAVEPQKTTTTTKAKQRFINT
jgi:hypothetical protein